MKITISGSPGSGKSTVRNLLAQKLNLKRYSTGDFMRQLATEKGLNLEEFSKIAQKDPSIDKQLDDRQVKLGKEENNFIIDGRLSFHFIPNSIKIFIDAKLEIRAQRILGDIQNNVRITENAKNLQEQIDSIKKREDSERLRYKQYYNLDPYDKSHYDLVIDSSDIDAEEIASKIITLINEQKLDNIKQQDL